MEDPDALSERARERVALKLSRRLHERLHLGPGIGREIAERRPVRVRHPIDDGSLDRRPLAHARPPIGDRRITIPHAGKFQKFEAQDIRNDRAVGVGKGIAGKVTAALQRAGHPRQQFLVLRNRLADRFGIEPVFDDAVLVFGAAVKRRLARGIFRKFGRKAVANVKIMQELCTYSSTSLLYIRDGATAARVASAAAAEKRRRDNKE